MIEIGPNLGPNLQLALTTFAFAVMFVAVVWLANRS